MHRWRASDPRGMETHLSDLSGGDECVARCTLHVVSCGFTVNLQRETHNVKLTTGNEGGESAGPGPQARMPVSHCELRQNRSAASLLHQQTLLKMDNTVAPFRDRGVVRDQHKGTPPLTRH